MLSKKDKDAIDCICRYYNVNVDCATYLYFRAMRSKRLDDKYIPFSLQIQNAIIKADKCYNFSWDSMKFGDEAYALNKYGIDLNIQLTDGDTKKVFKWYGDEKDNIIYKKKDTTNTSYTCGGIGECEFCTDVHDLANNNRSIDEIFNTQGNFQYNGRKASCIKLSKLTHVNLYI